MPDAKIPVQSAVGTGADDASSARRRTVESEEARQSAEVLV